MPQFEIDPATADATPSLVRGRDVADAVRRAAGLAEASAVEVEPTDDPAGWSDVRVDGSAWGRVRPHARMRFRRD